MQKIIAIATLILALLVVNWSIYKKEELLDNGKVVFLKLAPVDPRSLMQGDYMALRFEVANHIRTGLKENGLMDSNEFNKESIDGLIYVQLDEKNVASFLGIVPQDITEEAIANKGIVLQFRLRKGQIKFATNAYFFEEGTGKKLEAAEYGEFRVNHNGELLLVTLRDKYLVKLG
ncbi:MAG: putative membrane-anchored protein [Paraglaciecola sp.]|jgi:uncharacterized membrane-anchored protein